MSTKLELFKSFLNSIERADPSIVGEFKNVISLMESEDIGSIDTDEIKEDVLESDIETTPTSTNPKDTIQSMLDKYGIDISKLTDEEKKDIRDVAFKDNNGNPVKKLNVEALDLKLSLLSDSSVEDEETEEPMDTVDTTEFDEFKNKLKEIATTDKEKDMLDSMISSYKETLGGINE